MSLDKAKDFLCYVEGLSTVELFSDPNGLPDFLVVYGVKDISQVRSNALPGLLKHISTKPETKTIDVSLYKYILIGVNKDIPVTENDFCFIVKGDSSLLKSPNLVASTITTTKAPTTTLKPTTTKAPESKNTTTTTTTTTTKAPATTLAPASEVKAILDKSTTIKLNTKITDFDKVPFNNYICNVEGLTTVSVFMNPFIVPNNFYIIGIDSNNNIKKLFSSTWGKASKFVPFNVSKLKYLQISLDSGNSRGNAFEIKVIGDEKLLK